MSDEPVASRRVRRKDGDMTQFWEKVRKAVQGVAEDGAEALKEGATTVAEKAPKVASAVAGKSRDALRIADLKIQIRRLNIQAEQRLSELGGRVYEVLREGGGPVGNDPEARSLVEKVRALEKDIEDAERQVARLRGKEGTVQPEKKPEAKAAAPPKKPKRKAPAAKPATRTRPPMSIKSGRSRGSAAPARRARPQRPAAGKAT